MPYNIFKVILKLTNSMQGFCEPFCYQGSKETEVICKRVIRDLVREHLDLNASAYLANMQSEGMSAKEDIQLGKCEILIARCRRKQCANVQALFFKCRGST